MATYKEILEKGIPYKNYSFDPSTLEYIDKKRRFHRIILDFSLGTCVESMPIKFYRSSSIHPVSYEYLSTEHIFVPVRTTRKNIKKLHRAILLMQHKRSQGLS